MHIRSGSSGPMFVMPGPVPGMTSLGQRVEKGVDGLDKPGHDGKEASGLADGSGNG
jgi:hypothetical protein